MTITAANILKNRKYLQPKQIAPPTWQEIAADLLDKYNKAELNKQEIASYEELERELLHAFPGSAGFYPAFLDDLAIMKGVLNMWGKILWMALVSVCALWPATLFAASAQQLADAVEWPVQIKSYGGKLLLSDSPETVYGEGVLYQDTVVGEARLFFHHVNANDAPHRLAVLIENQSLKMKFGS